MDYLPEEITAIIISHFLCDRGGDHETGLETGLETGPTTPPRALAPYATVSRQWQYQIEATTFAHITLTPARLESPLAAQALTPERLRRFVRSVHVDVLLPPYDSAAWGRQENDEEKTRNNAVFTEIIRKVFALLSSSLAVPSPDNRTGGEKHFGQQQHIAADTATGYRAQIVMSMKARSISDTEKLEWRKTTFGRPPDITLARYQSSYLDLRPPAGKTVQDVAEALPELPLISRFKVDGSMVRSESRFTQCTRRYFAPRALCLMASKMPGLEAIEWWLCDNEKWNVELRKRLRADFANALPALPASLKDLSLFYDRSVPSDHSYQPPSILDKTDQGNDKLSLALHKLSQRLTIFLLKADVGPEILWPRRPEPNQEPSQQQQDDDLPLWPRMERYSILPGIITPSGTWLFRRPADYPSYSDDDADSYVSDYTAAVRGPGDDKEDHFREEPDPDVINPMLLAAARAAGRMPALRCMYFSARGPGPYSVGASYAVNGGRPSTGSAGADTAELDVVYYAPFFYLEEDVIQAWRAAAARGHVGDESRFEVTIEKHWHGT